jgi:hypothetical protein
MLDSVGDAVRGAWMTWRDRERRWANPSRVRTFLKIGRLRQTLTVSPGEMKYGARMNGREGREGAEAVDLCPPIRAHEHSLTASTRLSETAPWTAIKSASSASPQPSLSLDGATAINVHELQVCLAHYSLRFTKKSRQPWDANRHYILASKSRDTPTSVAL